MSIIRYPCKNEAVRQCKNGSYSLPNSFLRLPRAIYDTQISLFCSQFCHLICPKIQQRGYFCRILDYTNNRKNQMFNE